MKMTKEDGLKIKQPKRPYFLFFFVIQLFFFNFSSYAGRFIFTPQFPPLKHQTLNYQNPIFFPFSENEINDSMQFMLAFPPEKEIVITRQNLDQKS